MATLALSTANSRLQSPSRAVAVEDGPDHAIATSSADAFATLLDQLGPATSTPAPTDAAPVAAVPVPTPSATTVQPPPTPIVSSAALTTGPINAREALPKEGTKIGADEKVVPEALSDDSDRGAQADALPEATVPPASAPLPLPIVTMTTTTNFGQTASPPLPDQPTANSASSDIKPVALTPQRDLPVAADAGLFANGTPTQHPSSATADTDSGGAETTASPAKDASTEATAPVSTSPVMQEGPATTLERAMIAQSRTDPTSREIPANDAPIASDGEAKEISATAPTFGDNKTDVALKAPLPPVTFPTPVQSPTNSPAPSNPPPTAPVSRRNTDQTAPTRLESSPSTSSKTVEAKSMGDVSPPVVPQEIAPTATPVPSVVATAATPPPTTATRSTNAASPSTPAAQVATAIVEPVAVMLSNPSPANPAQPHVTTIQITPAELGRVDIRIERPSDGPAKIELVAERPETLSRLVHDQSMLHHALDQAGLAAGNRTIEFSLAPLPTASTSSGTLNNSLSSNDGGAGNGASHRQGGRYPNQGFAADDLSSPGSTVLRSIRSGIDITA